MRGAPEERPGGRRLTSKQDPAKEAVVPVQGVAVPAVLAELVLALRCPLCHAQANGTHHIRVSVAQLPLAAHQAWHIITHHPRGAACSSHVPGKGQHRGENPDIEAQSHNVSWETEFKALFQR